MFWIGFCVGVSVSFLIAILGLSFMTYKVSKEGVVARMENQAMMQDKLIKYWEKSNEFQERQIEALYEIRSAMLL